MFSSADYRQGRRQLQRLGYFELRGTRSGLKSGSLKFADDFPTPSSSSARSARFGSWRRHHLVRAVHSHLCYYVLHAVPAPEKAAAGTATIDFRAQNRRQSRNQRWNSRIDRECERDNRNVEGGR